MITIGKIRSLMLLGGPALAGATSGCFVETHNSPPPTVCADGAIAAEWTLTANGQAVSCAPGDIVQINADSMNAPFNCSAMAGQTPDLAGGFSYNVSLTLFNANNQVLSQTQTMSLFVPCGTVEDIGNVELSLTP